MRGRKSAMTRQVQSADYPVISDQKVSAGLVCPHLCAVPPAQANLKLNPRRRSTNLRAKEELVTLSARLSLKDPAALRNDECITTWILLGTRCWVT